MSDTTNGGPFARPLELTFDNDAAEVTDVAFSYAARLNASKGVWPGVMSFLFMVLFGIAVGGVAVGLAVFFGETSNEIVRLAAFFIGGFVLGIITNTIYQWLYTRRYRRRLMATIPNGKPVHMTLSDRGIGIRDNGTNIAVAWRAVQAVTVQGDRIEIDISAMFLYIPQRALPYGLEMPMLQDRINQAIAAGKAR